MSQPLGTASLALLGAIAALALLQGLFLLIAAWQAFRAVRRTESMAGQIGRELQPSVLELSRAARDMAEVSEITLTQARRLDMLMADAAEKVERAQSAFQRMLPAAGRVAAAAAVLRLMRSGFRVYRRLRG
jgi:hypothetical protein